MLHTISERLLPALQLTRMALVFTAISNTQCALLLRTRLAAGEGQSVLPYLDSQRMLAIVLVSVGLYGFGMSLNDIIDRRRDRQLAAHRPLPSGRMGIITAHVICIALALTALLAGGYYARVAPQGILSFILLVWTGGLIAFYDYAGKYLVWLGLLTLGLIRFFHAVIPAPELPVLWHPLLLLNHVTLLSTVAYAWEDKRPPLTRLHVAGAAGGLAVVNLVAIGLVWWRRPGGLMVRPDLLLPVGAALVFVLLAAWIRRRAAGPKAAGQSLMLAGLLWLIVYDAMFAAAYVGPLPALLLLGLAPVAYLSVVLMRWWSKLLSAAQPADYKRAGESR